MMELLMPCPLFSDSVVVAKQSIIQQVKALKRKTIIEVSLSDGRTLEGMFTTFDEYYQLVWMIPKGKKRFFRDASYRLRDIEAVRVISEPKTAVPVSHTESAATTHESVPYQLLDDGDGLGKKSQ
jgi:hypothetical protein